MCRKSCDDDRLFNYLERMCNRKAKLSKKNVDRNICHICDHTCHDNDHVCPRIADTTLLHTTYCCDYQCYPKLFQNDNSGQASQCICPSRTPSCDDTCIIQTPTDPCPRKKITCKKTCDKCKKTCNQCKKTCDPCKKVCEPCKPITTCKSAPLYPCLKLLDTRTYPAAIDSCDSLSPPSLCQLCKKQLHVCKHQPQGKTSQCQLCSKSSCLNSVAMTCHELSHHKNNSTCRNSCGHNSELRNSCGHNTQKIVPRVKVQVSPCPQVKVETCPTSSKCRRMQTIRIQRPTRSCNRTSNHLKKNNAKYQIIVTKVESVLKANSRDNYC